MVLKKYLGYMGPNFLKVAISLSLLLTTLSFLALFGEELALGLEPMPFFLDVFGCQDAVLLFLLLFGLVGRCLVILLLGQNTIFFFLLTFLAYNVNLLIGVFLLLDDYLPFIDQFIDFSLSQFVALIRYQLHGLAFFIDEADDLRGNFLFDFEILFEFFDFFLNFGLFDSVEALHGLEDAVNSSLYILNLKLTLNLRLIKLLTILRNLLS